MSAVLDRLGLACEVRLVAGALEVRARSLDLRTQPMDGWRGAAGDTARLAAAELDARVGAAVAAYAAAAGTLARCAAELEHAEELRHRAALLDQRDEHEQAAAARARAVARAAGSPLPPYLWDDASPLRTAAARLRAEAEELTAQAERRAAAELDGLRPARGLTLTQQAAGFGRGIGSTAADLFRLSRTLSPADALMRPVAHLRETRDLVSGVLDALHHPGAAVGAAAGTDQLRRGAYGEWLGSLLAGAVMPGGRAGRIGERVAAGPLERLTVRAVEAGGPVVARVGLRLPAGFPRHIADLTPQRRRHILDGDGPRKGGGHRSGVGKEGKTEFPVDWSDDDIISRVMQTATQPEEVLHQGNGMYAVWRRFDGVEVKVIVHPGGHVVTAHPEPGGIGVVHNPRSET